MLTSKDCCDVAREYATKAIEIMPDLTTALKTLTWSSLKSGETSFHQEDLIFRFLLHQHTCGAINVQGTTGVVSNEIVADYYEAVVSKYPKNATYLYFYAIYQSLV
ncbi:hypothetical protein M1146_06315 [Patescibacteria group bacterium]|nr:hypothetical protein [Patescibacteria group bacterium]